VQSPRPFVQGKHGSNGFALEEAGTDIGSRALPGEDSQRYQPNPTTTRGRGVDAAEAIRVHPQSVPAVPGARDRGAR
jgi:hypothetical protein